MERLQCIGALKRWRREAAGRIGFVPTMGALHAGHMTLVERAVASCDSVIVSIFVNPTQFNEAEDCLTYPQPLDRDLELCAAAGVEAVFLPQKELLYPDGYRYRVTETEASRELEGTHRPGHFDGVLTVVLKLLNLVRADTAYFGEKDWQQLQLVKGMAEAFFLDTCIEAVPTVREVDGLALSSRNVRLTPSARAKAPEFAAALRSAATPEAAQARLEAAGFTVEYVADRDGRRLGAVVLDGVRLIDALELEKVEA
jgi:pantoate--beta-alanine ligase